MNRAQCTAAIVWLDQLAAKAAEESAKLRDQLANEAQREYEASGTVPTWRIPDAATVSGSVSKQAAYVRDAAAFTAWVASEYPQSMEQVVRPEWQRWFLGRVQVVGDDVADPTTGVVVPGVAVRPGGRWGGIRIVATGEAKQALGGAAFEGLKQAVAHAGGPLAVAVLAELEAGPEAAS